MKNMTLPAKNCNRRKISLYAVFCILSVLTVLFAGCKKDEPTAPESLYGNVERPTWTVPSEYDYTSSMTAVIKVANLNGQMVNDQIVNDSDLLAAFSGDTCLGVAQPQDGLFFLYIAAPVTGNPSSVTLRYYCAHYKNLFEAKDAFRFINDDHLGTTVEPFKPAFVVAK